MSRQNSDRPGTILPSENPPTFGCRRRSGLGFVMPTGSGIVSRLVMGWVRILFLGALFKIVVPLGTIVVLFFFWPQILGIVTGGDASMGMDSMSIVRWSFSMLKSSLIGMVGA